jgi:hypothetical protein
MRPPRRRRSFLRVLEERYAKRRRAKSSGPVVYPVLQQRPAAPGHPVAKGIPMTMQQFFVLGILFIAIAWAGAGGVAIAVVEVTGGGERGEQGLQGPKGDTGLTGAEGPQGPAGDDAAQEMVKRLGAMFAVQQKSSLGGGAFVEFNDPDVTSCVEYLITGEPGASACPGFSGN